MVASDIISSILNGFSEVHAKCPQLSSFVSNDNGTSFYLSQKRGNDKAPIQIRLSNHGTYLRTWVDRQHLKDSRERLLDPSHCINISIVFVDEGKDITKDCPNQPNCENCAISPCVPQIFEGQNELGHPFTVYQFTYQSKFIRRRYVNGIVKAIKESISKGEYIDPLRDLYRQAKQKNLSSKTESKSNKHIIKTINETQLKQIVAEAVRRILNV